MDHSLSSTSPTRGGAAPADTRRPDADRTGVVAIGCSVVVRYADGRVANYRLPGGAQTGPDCVPLGSPLSAALLGAGIGEMRQAGRDGEPFEIVAIRLLVRQSCAKGGCR